MEPVSAVLTHNVVPLYAEPNGSSEQISQGLLGDPVQVIAEAEALVQVRTSDDYSGWVRKIHLRPVLIPDPLEQITAHFPDRRLGRVGQALVDVWETPERGRLFTKLVWGTQVAVLDTVVQGEEAYARVYLPCGNYDDPQPRSIRLGFVSEKALETGKPAGFMGETACELACRFVGTPYLWGGGTPFGFDCSGFVQRIYSVLGVTLPRDAYLQARSALGQFYEPGKARKAGDLVFFVGQSDPRGRGITHVGMALDNRHFIHAYGKRGVIISGFNDPEMQEVYTDRGSWRRKPPSTKTTGKV